MQFFFFNLIVGNILTKYHQALFTLLSPILSISLLKEYTQIEALFFAYSLIGIDWISRPLGAIFFGRLGDRQGSWTALRYSIVGTLLVGLLTSSVFLCLDSQKYLFILIILARWVQGFSSTGETTNGAMLMLEKVSIAEKSRTASIYDAFAVVGALLALSGISVLKRIGYLTQYWPCFFWISSVGALGVFLIRWKVNVSSNAEVPKEKKVLDLWTVLKLHSKLLLSVVAVSGFFYTTYTLSFTLMHSYIPLVSHSKTYSFIEFNFIVMLMDLLLLPAWGYCANYWGYRNQMLGAVVLTIISIIPMIYSAQINAWYLLACQFWIVILGTAFAATYHVWIQSVIPKEVRVRIASLGYTLGSRFVGAPAALLSLWLYKSTGLNGAPFIYLGITALGAMFAIYNTTLLKHDV